MKDDPAQIKYKLSEFGNRVLEDMWLTKGCPKNISIAQQPLQCEGNLRIARYGFPSSRNYDGIHMRGKMAVQHYTGSLINVLLDVLPGSKTSTKSTPPPTLPPQSFAQPQLVRGFVHPSVTSSPRPGDQFPDATHAMPPRGQNMYNVNTQNRFSTFVSGN